MSGVEAMARALYAWTPFLAGGFAWNIVISLVALVAGAGYGYGLALLRLSARRMLRAIGDRLTSWARNVPTFVFQYYLVFMLPNALPVPLTHVAMPLPSWAKAALALALAVAGFVSDNLLRPLRDRRMGAPHGASLFVSNLANYFVVIVMASSTASVVGVPELVSRCNTVINALGRTDAMLWIYLYGMGWFCAFCLAATALLASVSRVFAD